MKWTAGFLLSCRNATLPPSTPHPGPLPNGGGMGGTEEPRCHPRASLGRGAGALRALSFPVWRVGTLPGVQDGVLWPRRQEGAGPAGELTEGWAGQDLSRWMFAAPLPTSWVSGQRCLG